MYAVICEDSEQDQIIETRLTDLKAGLRTRVHVQVQQLSALTRVDISLRINHWTQI